MKYPEVYEHFKQIAEIPESEWLFLEDKFRTKTFSKGEHLIEAGEQSQYLFLVTEGLLRSYYIDQEGKEFNKIFFTDGEIASAYVEMLTNVPSRVNIQAIEKTNILLIPYFEIQKLYDRHPVWNLMGRKIAERFFTIKESREYEFLLLDAQSRYENFLKDYADIKHRIPQYHIASYLGITSVSLSRLINKK